MRRCILGDVHGGSNLLPASLFMERLEETHGGFDQVVQVGDFGFWPHLFPYDRWSMTTKRSSEYLWIDGNHEDHEALAKLEGLLWDQWQYVPRGTVREGTLFIGGARSIDAHRRMQGVDWFPGEELSYADVYRALEAVEAAGGVHTVISHDCPISFPVVCSSEKRRQDATRNGLQAILEEVQPDNWFFGHYHKKQQGEMGGCSWRCVGMLETGDYVIQEW